MKLVILLVVIVVIGVGLGWLHFSSSNDAGRPNVTVSVDKNKVVDQIQDLRHKPADKTAVTTQKVQD